MKVSYDLSIFDTSLLHSKILATFLHFCHTKPISSNHLTGSYFVLDYKTTHEKNNRKPDRKPDPGPTGNFYRWTCMRIQNCLHCNFSYRVNHVQTVPNCPNQVAVKTSTNQIDLWGQKGSIDSWFSRVSGNTIVLILFFFIFYFKKE